MSERPFAKHSKSVKASLAIGTCCAIFLLMFVVLSSEGRRRIAIEIGVNEPVPQRYGEARHAAMAWQIRNVLGLSLVFLGSAVALALGIVASRDSPQARVIATAGICLSLLDLTAVALLVWGIS